MGKCLTIFAIVILSGCASTPHAPLNPPIFPLFYEYTEAEWFGLPDYAKEAITADDLACKQYRKEVESRISIHNGRSD